MPVGCRPVGQGGRPIRIIPAIVLGFTLALCPLLGGCGGDKGEPNTTDYRLSGTVLDAETGKEVSRETLYLHFFCDDVDMKKTLNPGPGSAYEVLMPKAKVRVRAFDQEKVYALFEQVVEMKSKSETFEIRLKPTNFIRLHGKVAGYQPPGPDPKPGDSIMLYFEHGGRPIAGPMAPNRDGTYSLRVPRGKITISAVNTAGKIKNPTVDLTGNTGEAHEHNIQFE